MFSLLKLMLVVALIGFLVALAVPTFKTYLQKIRFIETVHHSHTIRVAQSACLLQVGDNISACDTFAELAVPEPELSDSANIQAIALTLNTGMITGTGSPAAGSYTFTLTPSIKDDGLLTYTLGSSCLSVGFCRSYRHNFSGDLGLD